MIFLYDQTGCAVEEKYYDDKNGEAGRANFALPAIFMFGIL